MRILVLGINYWPDETGIAAFNTWRCEYLAAAGHQVTVCTGFPYYPQWRVPKPYRGRAWQREQRNGVTILRSWLWVPQQINTARRMLHEASFLVTSLVSMLAAEKPDVILSVSPPLGLGLSAFLLSCLWGVPYIFDVEDLQPDAAVDLGMLRAGPLVRVLYGMESIAYRHAALVSTLTEGMRQRIIAKGIPRDKVAVFPPRADEYLFTARTRGNGARFRGQYGLGDKFLVIHSGNMGVKQGLTVVLDAAQRSASFPDVLYVFVGDGAVRPYLQQRAAELRLSNVRFLPVLPREIFFDMLAAANVCLITQQRSVADIVFPSKTVTLLAAGCPVVASVNAASEIARVVRASGGGRVISPEDGEQLHVAIAELRSRRHELVAMGNSGRAYAQDHWDGCRVLPLMEAAILRAAGGIPSLTPAEASSAD